MKSLAYHANLRNDLSNEQMGQREKLLVKGRILEELKECRWRIPDDFLEFSHFKRIVEETVMWNSSPGYPYLLRTPTNRSFFEVVDGKPSNTALERAWYMVQQRLEQRISDPIRLFIKPEPLTSKKLKDFRYRLISSVSIIDQLIDSMLFTEFNDAIIRNCDKTPVKAGWTPYMGGWKQVPMKGFVSTDKFGWDWTVQPWLIQESFEIIVALCENMTPIYEELMWHRVSELFKNPIFVTSGGLLLRQENPGVMKSGCKVTITLNSLMQLVLQYRVAVEVEEKLDFLWAMGDDVIQSKMSKEYFDKLSEYCIVKEISSHVEFAGYRFNGYGIQPLYPNKHAFMIQHQEEKYHEETANAYILMYHRSTLRQKWEDVLSQLNNKLVEKEVLDLIWDGKTY